MTDSYDHLRALNRHRGAWAYASVKTIRAVHAALPEGATLAERKSAVDAAYPFGLRENYPYKAWLRVRREYLAIYSKPEDAEVEDLPLLAAMRVRADGPRSA